jgi:eukaryotic-like serine/threonine-protein kinase
LSPDGTTAILEESWEGGGAARSIYLRTMDGAPAVRLGDGVPLALSPDKRWVVSTPAAGTELNLVPTSVGQPRVLPRGPVTSFFPAARWLPDGRSILFSGTEPGRQSRVYLQSIESGEPRAITPESVFGRIAVMPDGKAFVTRGTDRRLAMVTLDGKDVRPLARAEPGDLPIVCSADGRWLYVQAGSDVPAEIARIDLQSGRREAVRTLRPPDPSGVSSILRIVMTPDGGSYAYTYIRAVSALYLVEGLR